MGDSPYTSLNCLDALDKGDHACLYFNEDSEHRAALASFVKAGLDRDERVLCILGDVPREEVAGSLESKFDLNGLLAAGRLMFIRGATAASHGGVFRPLSLLPRLAEQVDRAIQDGYSALRVAGDMTWLMTDGRLNDEGMLYEANVNALPELKKMIGLCMYDARRFPAEAHIDALIVHPVIVSASRAVGNPWYMPPDKFMSWPDTRSRLDAQIPVLAGRIVEVLISRNDLMGMNAGLEKENTELRTSLESKTDFASMVAHELKNPLSAIQSLSDLIIDEAFGKPPREIKEAVRYIRGSADALGILIDDLLLVYRKERGALVVNLSPVPLAALFEELRANHTKMSHGKEFVMRVEAEPLPLPLIAMADPFRLREVIQNLLANAIKYSGSSVEVVVRTYRRDSRAVITVTDNGHGIPESELPRIFENFYRIDQRGRKKVDGTGLGLAISKHLVELMNGTISAESKLGEGTTFTVELDLVV
jgi:signal transduction histidine kinase